VDFVTGKQLFELELGGQHAAPLVPPVVSPDGKTVAVALAGFGAPDHPDGVMLFDAATGKATKTLTGLGRGASAIAFSRDGKALLAGSRNTTTLVYELTAP
jgi:hypothetical protein